MNFGIKPKAKYNEKPKIFGKRVAYPIKCFKNGGYIGMNTASEWSEILGVSTHRIYTAKEYGRLVDNTYRFADASEDEAKEWRILHMFESNRATSKGEGYTLNVTANIRHPEDGFVFTILRGDGKEMASVWVDQEEAEKIARSIISVSGLNEEAAEGLDFNFEPFDEDSDDEDALWS